MSRVSVVYREEQCVWMIYVSIDTTKTRIQIKTFYAIYTCGN
jgi:hypothetical protein